MRHIYFEIAEEDNSTESADALLSTAKLPRLHISLHDVNTVFLVEGHAGDLIETNHIVLTNQSSLSSRVVNEHSRHRRLSTRNQVRIRGYLLKEMTLARPARTELDCVIVVLYKWNHAEQHHVTSARRKRCWLKADAAEQKVAPLLERK